MASPFCSGPAFIFCGISSGATFNASGPPIQQITPAFLGTSETGPQMAHQLESEPVMNDIAGSKIPHDNLYMGEIAFLTFTLTIWNEAVIQRLERKLNDPNIVTGVDGATDRGSLYIAEGLAWPMWLLYGHRNKPIMLANGLPAGRHYLYTMPDSIITLPGRRANRKQVTMTALGGYDSLTGIYKLWDQNMTEVANLPIV